MRERWVLVGVVLALIVPEGSNGADERRAWIGAAVEVYNEHASDPLPFLSSRQVDDLLSGRVVRIRRRDVDGPEDRRAERVTGYALYELPRRRVWLAALDPAFRATDLLTEVRLRRDGDGGSLWYQHVDLPWPIADRHWVIELEKGLEVAERTEGFVWEQRWRLAADGPAIARRTLAEGRAAGLDERAMDEAVYLPLNLGSWTLFALTDELTLLAYRVSTVVGGNIPDGWIATFAMAQLEGLLRGVGRHALEVESSYDPAVEPIHGGDGRLLPALERR